MKLPSLTRLLLIAAALFWAAEPVVGQVSFRVHYLDTQYGGNTKPGWVQAGDMDGDGDMDVVAGGGRALYIYENQGGGTGWRRHGNLDSTDAIGANAGILIDIDGDGDLDVLSGKYAKELGWWKNPGGPLRTTKWTFQRVSPGVTAWFLHDMVLVDLDGDGKAREVVFNLHLNTYWNAPVQIFWMRVSSQAGDWPLHTIQSLRAGPNHCHAGFGVGDINRDGHVDLSYSNGWYEAPADPTGTWKWHSIVQNIYGVSNSRVGDIDGDGAPDLIVSAGHHGKGVYWMKAVDLAKGIWTTHPIDLDIIHPEGLQVYDLDGDGDQDVVASELFFGEKGEPKWIDPKHNLYFLENLGGNPPTWKKINVAPNSYPSHLPYLFDINGDRKFDLISEGAGAPVVTYFENTTPPKSLRVDKLTPSTFLPLQDSVVRITGTGFTDVTGVRMGSQSIRSTDPRDWVKGYFKFVSSTQIDLYPPQDGPPGIVSVILDTPAGSSAGLPLQFQRSAQTLVRTEAAVVAGGNQEILIHGPGLAMSYVMVSGFKSRMDLPGIVTMEVGGTQPWVLYGPFTHDSQSGVLTFGPYATLPVMKGTELHIQAAVWDANNPVLPLPTSNTATTRYQ